MRRILLFRRHGYLAVGALLLPLALSGCDLGAAPTDYAGAGRPIGAGDVDGDGDVDIVTSLTLGADYIGVLEGDGNGAFSLRTVPHPDPPCDPSDTQELCHAWVEATPDVNNDGLADVIVGHRIKIGTQDRQLRVLRLADGSGGFEDELPVDDYRYGSSPRVFFGDVTSDGFVDLLTVDSPAGNPGALLRVRPGDGAGGFGSEITSSYPHVMFGSGVRIHDVNSDGHAELVFSGGCIVGNSSQEEGLVGCVRVMQGDGSGSFPSFTTLLAADIEVDLIHPVDFGDLNDDGSLDIVGGNFGNEMDGGGRVGSLSVFLADGAGGFGPEISYPATEETINVEVADFDGDGQLDVFTTVDQGDFRGKVLFGSGDGQFVDSHLLLDGTMHLGFVADVDGNGRADVVTSTSGNAARIYLNHWTERPA